MGSSIVPPPSPQAPGLVVSTGGGGGKGAPRSALSSLHEAKRRVTARSHARESVIGHLYPVRPPPCTFCKASQIVPPPAANAEGERRRNLRSSTPHVPGCEGTR